MIHGFEKEKKKVGTEKAHEALRTVVLPTLVWTQREREEILELSHSNRSDTGMGFCTHPRYESDLMWFMYIIGIMVTVRMASIACI